LVTLGIGFDHLTFAYVMRQWRAAMLLQNLPDRRGRLRQGNPHSALLFGEQFQQHAIAPVAIHQRDRLARL
jgi:hypothetical protein